MTDPLPLEPQPPPPPLEQQPQQQQQQQQQLEQQPQHSDGIDKVSDLFGDMFLDDSYSIESLLKKAKENNLSLNQLRNQLMKHQQDLNQTSLELFNNSYDRFYKLSHLIACLGEPIQHVINPLENYRNQLGQLCHSHDSYLDEINKKLALLEETSNNKYLSGKLIVLIRRRERIFQQLHRIEWLKRPSIESIIGEPVDSIEHKVNCDAIERIFVELYHLDCCISAIQPTNDELHPIKASLLASVKQQQSHLSGWFYDVFREAIQAQNKTIIEFVLRAYKQIGDYSELVDVWRNVIVKPYLDLTISSDSKLLANMGETYRLLVEFLEKHVTLIDAQLVVVPFWREIIEALDKLDRLYSPGDGLDVFRERYLLTNKFLNLYKTSTLVVGTDKEDGGGGGGCGGGGSGSSTNVGGAVDIQRILNKFDLMGYFGQRTAKMRVHFEAGLAQQPLSELATPTSSTLTSTSAPASTTTTTTLAAALAAPLQPPPPPGDSSKVMRPEFNLKISGHLYDLIVGCWSNEVYIPSLDGNFCEFVCELLSRYADWLGALRLSDFRIVGAANAHQHQQQHQQQQQQQQTRRTTDFLAKQDAIMRLLVDDCQRLEESIKWFMSERQLAGERQVSILSSFNRVRQGLNNVRNLQQLLER